MLQRRKDLLIALFVVVCSFVLLLPAFAESNVRIVRLSYIDGDAQINTTGQNDGFTHAVLNTPVTAGMWVYTPDKSHAEIQFENGSTVRLVDDAQVQFEKLALADSGAKIDIINVDHGIVYFNFDKVSKDDNILINVGGKSIRIEKSSHLRVNADEKNALVSVFKGEAKVDGDNAVEIKSSETVNLVASGDLKPGKGIDELGSDTWDKHRDGEVAALGFKSSPVNYPDPYSAQFSYLSSYGNYTMIPGYGWGWQPFGMGAGWDPYSSGLWNYNPGYGYMWVSSYPWGWGPYRYGMWNYVPAYGWMWMPGSSYTSWNVGPRYGMVPNNWHAPTAPIVNPRGKVVNTVVVGNPPNVHPAILAGHPEAPAHPITNVRTNAALNAGTKGAPANPGAATKPTSRTAATNGAGSKAPPQHSAQPARNVAPMGGTMGHSSSGGARPAGTTHPH